MVKLFRKQHMFYIINALGIAILMVLSMQAMSQTTILFFGNSLTAGYGLSPEEAFPALVKAKREGCTYHQCRPEW